MAEQNFTGGEILGISLPPSFFDRLKVLKPHHIAEIEGALARAGPSGRVRIVVEHGQASAIIEEEPAEAL